MHGTRTEAFDGSFVDFVPCDGAGVNLAAAKSSGDSPTGGDNSGFTDDGFSVAAFPEGAAWAAAANSAAAASSGDCPGVGASISDMVNSFGGPAFFVDGAGADGRAAVAALGTSVAALPDGEAAAVEANMVAAASSGDCPGVGDIICASVTGCGGILAAEEAAVSKAAPGAEAGDKSATSADSTSATAAAVGACSVPGASLPLGARLAGARTTVEVFSSPPAPASVPQPPRDKEAGRLEDGRPADATVLRRERPRLGAAALRSPADPDAAVTAAPLPDVNADAGTTVGAAAPPGRRGGVTIGGTNADAGGGAMMIGTGGGRAKQPRTRRATGGCAVHAYATITTPDKFKVA